jgi:hypothetical protein
MQVSKDKRQKVIDTIAKYVCLVPPGQVSYTPYACIVPNSKQAKCTATLDACETVPFSFAGKCSMVW